MTRVAAIDCGTNSVRLLVADVPAAGAGLVDVVRTMQIVRLGQGVDRTGRLDPDAIERVRVVLADYARQITQLGAQRVRMVATSATRDASNAADFRDMVLATLGAPPEVITGDEEARLSFLGATRGLPADAQPPYLVVDIGGGSTEFVLGGPSMPRPSGPDMTTVDGSTTVNKSTRGDVPATVDDRVTVTHAVSVDIGCVRMTERHLLDDPPTPEQIAAAEADIAATVDRALAVVPGHQARTLIGLAGSVTTVAALALHLPAYDPKAIHHSRIAYADVAAVTRTLLTLSQAERLALPPMHPGRADVIGAGALILRVIMEKVGADSVVVSEHDILDGIALSLCGD
ncbi:MAG: Ppx/GppA family phosphatase [Micromonosporaceae bacterium]|nr:Ppx/GppA family phosphatase [Micromonosporaceae bacterium]